MGSFLNVEQSATAVPLVFVIDGPSGGIGGLTPTVAVRDGSTTDSYLDWSDNTFKTSGWTLKNAPMTEITAGIYQRSLDILALLKDAGFTMVAEYAVSDPAASGVDTDVLTITRVGTDSSLARKFLTNRLEAEGGSPNGTQTLYDDDSTTPLGTQQLRDYAGGAVVNTPGSPARRTKLA